MKTKITLVNTGAEWEQFKKDILQYKEICFDLETKGLYGDILCISVSWKNREAYVIPVWHKDGLLEPQEVLAFFRKTLLQRPILLIGHNICYDIVCLARQTGGESEFSCEATDSMAYHFMLDENAPDRTLDFLTKEYTEYGNYKKEINVKAIANMDIEDVVEYSGLDAITPSLAAKAIRNELYQKGYGSPHMEKFFKRIYPFVSAMETNGMKVDIDILEEEKRKEEDNNAQLMDKAQSFSPEVNLASPKQLSEFIYKDLGCSVPNVKGAEGNLYPSTAEKYLKLIRPRHPFLQALLDSRKSTRQLTHYFGKTEQFLTPEGYVHPQYFVVKSSWGGTVSGRFSVKDPAVQTFSKSPVRTAYVSRHKDGVLIGIDGAQMELRYAAQLSGDETLCETFRGGLDPHQATADLVEQPRSIGKLINFAGIYGVTASGLHEKAGLSRAESVRTVAQLKKAWSGLYEYIDKVKFFIIHNQRVNTPYGRWRRLPGANIYDGIGRYKIREGVNFIVQSVASDIVQLLGWDLWKKGLTPILSNHDGLMFDVKPQDVGVCLDKMDQSVLSLPMLVKEVLDLDLIIPFKFDVKLGKNWLEVEEETYRSFSTIVGH